MKPLFFFLLLFFTCPLIAKEPPHIELIKQFSAAKPGDYFLYNHKKTAALMVVRQLDNESLIFEEIHAPLNFKEARNLDVEGWIKKKAPGHTAWIESRIDRKTGEVKGSFCHLRQGALAASDQRFTSTLLSLLFKAVPKEERRLCGVDGGTDDMLPRRLWKPPAPKGIDSIEAVPYFSRWPKDGSEIAGGRIEVYISPKLYLPTWIEVRKSGLKENIRLIKVGSKLK